MQKVIAICAVLIVCGSTYGVVGTWAPLDYPDAISTCVWDIDGGAVVGSYNDGYRTHGFRYDMATQNWTTLDEPGAINTEVLEAIS
jgi:hypothetical protein